MERFKEVEILLPNRFLSRVYENRLEGERKALLKFEKTRIFDIDVI